MCSVHISKGPFVLELSQILLTLKWFHCLNFSESQLFICVYLEVHKTLSQYSILHLILHNVSQWLTMKNGSTQFIFAKFIEVNYDMFIAMILYI